MDPDSQTTIELYSAERTFLIDPEKIQTLVYAICSGLGVGHFEVSWDFADDDAMQDLNRQYRDKDKSTDVLSFPQHEWENPLTFSAPVWPLPELDEETLDGPPEVLGDVVINPGEALRNARNIGHDLDREICFLLVHGILHLCGHDHMVPEEEERMTTEQQSIMRFLETAPSEPLWLRCARFEV